MRFFLSFPIIPHSNSLCLILSGSGLIGVYVLVSYTKVHRNAKGAILSTQPNAPPIPPIGGVGGVGGVVGGVGGVSGVSQGYTYIGFTVDPCRRVLQHNGALTGGAVRTVARRPWSMVLYLFGFQNQVWSE